jgi:two-component system CheB/CheR fusion protein
MYALASGLNTLAQPTLERAVFTPYLAGLVAVGLFSGVAPGAVMLFAATVTVQTVWVEPYGDIWAAIKLNDAAALALWVTCGAAVLAVAAKARRLLQWAHEARNDHEQALRAGKMATWRWDIETDALTFSPGAREVLGLDSLPTSMGEGWLAVDDLHRSTAQADVAAAVASGGDFEQLTKMSAAGLPRWVETHGRVVSRVHGKPRQVVAVMVDVTQRQEALIKSQAAEKKLEEEATRKDTFLATLAHELRSPLAPIRYAVAMLGDEARPAHRQIAKDTIARQSAHMARLLDDLLDMSRITRNDIQLHREVLDLRPVVQVAVDNLQHSASLNQKSILVAASDVPVYVDGDATRLQQVVDNLLDNALKFSAPGGEVHVSVALEGAHALIRVRDFGEGIDPAVQNSIFELFTQVQAPGQGRGGLGIGLAITKQLVQLHGGSVDVHSDGLGTGSEFKVHLPLAVQTPRQAEAWAANVISLPTSGRVLVVDDSADTADMLAAILRLSGFTASVAYTGEQAIDAFTALRPAAVLLDLGLPDLHGTEVALRIRALPGGSEVRLVAITGWGQEKDRAETAAAGFDRHFVKPVDPSTLLTYLQCEDGQADKDSRMAPPG